MMESHAPKLSTTISTTLVQASQRPSDNLSSSSCNSLHVQHYASQAASAPAAHQQQQQIKELAVKLKSTHSSSGTLNTSVPSHGKLNPATPNSGKPTPAPNVAKHNASAPINPSQRLPILAPTYEHIRGVTQKKGTFRSVPGEWDMFGKIYCNTCPGQFHSTIAVSLHKNEDLSAQKICKPQWPRQAFSVSVPCHDCPFLCLTSIYTRVP